MTEQAGTPGQRPADGGGADEMVRMTPDDDASTITHAHISNLKIDPPERNPRLHPEDNLAAIEQCARELGALRPGLCDENNEMVCGTGARISLERAGIVKVKIVDADPDEWVVARRSGMSEEDKRRAAFWDNFTGELAQWNPTVYAEMCERALLSGIPVPAELHLRLLEQAGGDFLTRHGEPAGGEEGKSLKVGGQSAQLVGGDDDRDTAERTDEERARLLSKWGVARGQVWQIPSRSADGWCHTLVCGDTHDPAVVEAMMRGESGDIGLFDPPYGMDVDTDWRHVESNLSPGARGKAYERVEGDNKPYDPAPIFEHFDYLKEIFLFGADYYVERIPPKYKYDDEGMHTDSWLVWDKRTDTQAEGVGSEFELIWSRAKHKRRTLRHDWFGFLSSQNGAEARNRKHPNQKPTSLLRDILSQWADPGEVVVEMYLGSGSVMVAAEQLGMICHGGELKAVYVAECLERLSRLGLEPRRISG